MIAYSENIKLFSGNANPEFARRICRDLGISLGACEVTRFADGEISVNLQETVRGCDVFLVQPTCKNVNDHLMELLIMIDACRRASAGRITAVIPYFGYARQDRKAHSRDPISAKLVANMLTAAGANRILTMDLHAAQLEGFFDIPVDHLLGRPLFVDYYQKKFPENMYAAGDFTAISPDVGSVNRARYFAEQMHIHLGIIDKRRPKANVSQVMNVIGNVEGKICILYDDLVDTAGSLCHAAEALAAKGAREVYACASHGVLSGDACRRIGESPIREMVFLNTIPLPETALSCGIRELDAAPVFARAINHIHSGTSIAELF